MPVLRPRRSAKKGGNKSGQRLTLEQKLAKMAIADVWLRDEDGTKYYINVAVNDGRNWVRVRVDIPGSEPLTLLLEPDFAIQLATAIFRAAFNARIMKPEEVAQLWQQLRGQFKGGRAAEKSAKRENAQDKVVREEEADIPDFGFA